MRKPVIGISAVASFDEHMYSQRVTYVQAVWKAGGEVLLLPCNLNKDNCRQIVGGIDGLLVPGGHDMDPGLYGEDKIEACGEFTRYEDEYEMELIDEAVKQRKPVLGICRGMQVINVLYGGTLYQDIPKQYSGGMIHTRIQPTQENFHTVNLERGSYLAKMVGGARSIRVNSSHHQAVKDVARGFHIVAKTPDGIIEAIENEDASIMCVQWHPERMQNIKTWQNFMRDYVDRCRWITINEYEY